MRLEALRTFCLSLPRSTESIKWEEHLAFCVAEKIFCITTLEPARENKLSFKCTPEIFAELVEREGVLPAPYLARNHWVSLSEWDALPSAELKDRLRDSYELVVAKLPKRVRAEFTTEARKHADLRKKIA